MSNAGRPTYDLRPLWAQRRRGSRKHEGTPEHGGQREAAPGPGAEGRCIPGRATRDHYVSPARYEEADR
jgi:hypothetical protein